MTLKNGIKVDMASGSDFDEIPKIVYRAFANDVSSQMCFKNTPESIKYMGERFRKAAAEPRSQILKATSPEGNVCGMSLWHFVPDPEEEALEKKKKDEEKERKKGTPDEEPDTPPGANAEEYRAYFNGVIYAQRGLVAGQKRAVLELLAVDPDYQGHGIGKALIKAGATIAESQGIPFIWLEATTAGYPLYKKLGFEDVDVKDFDWAPFGRNAISRSVGMKKMLPMDKP